MLVEGLIKSPSSPAFSHILNDKSQADPRHMSSPGSDSLRGHAHRLTEAARGTEASPLPGLPLSSISPLSPTPDARLSQDWTSWPSLFSSNLSEAASMDRGYHRCRCECGVSSNVRRNSSVPNDVGTPQASEAASSITLFDRTSSAGT